MRDVVTNTSPLLYLHQLGLISLLPDLYERVVVPTAVVGELEEGARLGYSVPSPEALPWVDVQAAPMAELLALVTDLGPGERAAIAIARARRSDLLLLDDGLARRHARLLGLRISGTLGVLLRAKQEGLIPSVGPRVAELERLGFRLAAETREAVLRLAGE